MVSKSCYYPNPMVLLRFVFFITAIIVISFLSATKCDAVKPIFLVTSSNEKWVKIQDGGKVIIYAPSSLTYDNTEKKADLFTVSFIDSSKKGFIAFGGKDAQSPNRINLNPSVATAKSGVIYANWAGVPANDESLSATITTDFFNDGFTSNDYVIKCSTDLETISQEKLTDKNSSQSFGANSKSSCSAFALGETLTTSKKIEEWVQDSVKTIEKKTLKITAWGLITHNASLKEINATIAETNKSGFEDGQVNGDDFEKLAQTYSMHFLPITIIILKKKS